MYVDCHCHLDHPDLWEDSHAIIERAKKAGLAAIINNGINPETNRRTLELAKRYGIVRPALGIYPVKPLRKDIEEHGLPLRPNIFDIDEEIDFISRQKIAAIGEVGLDYVDASEADREEQRETFQKMIDLALRMGKPLIVHSRKAEEDVISMLERSGCKDVVLHCFSGKISLFRRAADLGWHFTIATHVVRSEQVQIMAKELNLRQILTETDSPYLSPFRERMNEPAHVVESVKKIAEIKGLEVEEMKKIIFMNYQRLFTCLEG